MSNNLLTDELSTPLDGTTTACININSGIGNLIIDQLSTAEPQLASGTLEYFEKQGRPARTIQSHAGQTTLTVTGCGSGQPWFRLPWTACLGATEWRIHVNPTVASEVVAHTGGGNLKVNLATASITGLSADTGGGNLDVVLPEHAANLHVTARTGAGNLSLAVGDDMTGRSTLEASSGAGNVQLHMPRGLAARVHATSGLGKVTVEPGFTRLDRQTYESADFETAANKVEVTLKSGAGNVSVSTM